VKVAEPQPAAPAQAAAAAAAVTSSDEAADAVFDAQDAAFALGLMDTHRAPQEAVETPNAEAAPESSPAQPTLPKNS
jgi:hypothetical protein